MRQIHKGIFYVLHSGGVWRLLPHGYPPWSTVYDYFRKWRNADIWEGRVKTLRERLRVQNGRQESPSAAILDSQSVQATERGRPHGFDGGKKLSGRKRHILVASMRLLLKVVVYRADIQDRKGIPFLLEPAKGQLPRMEKVWVDNGYTGTGRNWIKQDREEYQDIHSQVLQDVLRRVDKAFQAFFARCKRGDTPGFPRYKGRNQFDSFTYPQAGYSLTADNRLRLSKIGSIKVKVHREIKGVTKTCTIKREGEHWYVMFACEVEAMPLEASHEAIGIDLGLLHFATLSTGETIENPRYYRKAEQRLEGLQQSLSRKKRGSGRRRKAIKRIARAHQKVANQRRDFLHKASHSLVHSYGLIVFEELQPSNMSKRAKPKQDENGNYLPNGGSAKSGLNKSIVDAGWSQFVQFCTFKAESAGRTMVQVNPRYTSQVCSGCGQVRKKDLSERWHHCDCGTELDRDHNAALNILRLGRSRQASA